MESFRNVDVEVGGIGEGDLPALAELYAELTGEPAAPEGMRAEFARLAANADYILLGARLGEKLAGAVMGLLCRKLSRDCRPALLLENLVVARSHRRRRVGAALLAEMERMAKARNCYAIVLVSSTKRTDAHAFYAAMGYAEDKVLGFRKKLSRP